MNRLEEFQSFFSEESIESIVCEIGRNQKESEILKVTKKVKCFYEVIVDNLRWGMPIHLIMEFIEVDIKPINRNNFEKKVCSEIYEKLSNYFEEKYPIRSQERSLNFLKKLSNEDWFKREKLELKIMGWSSGDKDAILLINAHLQREKKITKEKLINCKEKIKEELLDYLKYLEVRVDYLKEHQLEKITIGAKKQTISFGGLSLGLALLFKSPVQKNNFEFGNLYIFVAEYAERNGNNVDKVYDKVREYIRGKGGRPQQKTWDNAKDFISLYFPEECKDKIIIDSLEDKTYPLVTP